MTLCDDIESDLQAVRRIFFEYPKQLQYAREELQKNHEELLDVAHVFEFGNINGPDTMKLSKLYKDLRRKRRQLKNDVEVLEKIEPLKEKLHENDISKPIGDIRNLKEVQNNRSYRMKVRKELEKYMVR